MIFCKVCGEALNLFETRDEEVCYTCLRKGIQQEPPAPVVRETGNADFLAEVLLGHEDGKLVVRSPEGWILWSAPDSETHSLGAILARAGRIHEIRKKRRK
jgi:hypothetical protein